jgi:hypothetical protein
MAFLHTAVASQFLSDWQMGLIRSSDEPAYLLSELVQGAGLSPPAQLEQI